MPTPPIAASLTPFVGALRQRVADAAREFLGVPTEAHVDHRIRADGVDLRVMAPSRAPGTELRVSARERPPSDRAARDTPPAIETRFVADRDRLDPGLAPVLAGLASRRRQGKLDAEELLAAAAAYRPFVEITDRHYRNVELGSHGVTGFLRLGFRCNQDCAFCWQGRSWPGPPEGFYWRWLDELGALGLDVLTISGGEPTLFRRLPELITRATTEYGMEVSLQTNAIQFSKAGYAESLADAGLGALLVSLHSADAALSDQLTRAPGTFERTVRGVRAALEAGIDVAINCVVERENVSGLADLVRFVEEQFVGTGPGRILNMNFSQAGDYYDGRRFEEAMVPLDEVRGPLTEATRLLAQAEIPAVITGTCGFPDCVLIDDEALLPPPPPEGRDEGHMAARTHELEACDSCRRRDGCAGVRKAYRERFGDRGVVPFR